MRAAFVHASQVGHLVSAFRNAIPQFELIAELRSTIEADANCWLGVRKSMDCHLKSGLSR